MPVGLLGKPETIFHFRKGLLMKGHSLSWSLLRLWA